MNPYSNSSIPPLPFLPPHDPDPLIMDDHQQQDLLDQSQAQQELRGTPEQPEQPEQHEQQEQSEQEDQPPKQKRQKIDGRKRPLLPLPPLYKIQLHLRKGEPLERRRLTSGLPDPEPYDHIQGQDSFDILLERIAARVAQFPELFWPENGSPYIKPAESVPQKYYQLLTPDNYEAHMAKAWRMEAKRLQDQSAIVLNLFVYLKDRNPPPEAAAAVPASKRRGRKPAAAVKEAAVVHPPVAAPASVQAALAPPSPGTAVAGAPGRRPHPRPPPEHGSPYMPIRPPPPHLHGPRLPPPPRHGPPGRRPRPGARPPGMDGRRVRGSPADQAIHSILTPGEAVIAAINSSVVSEAPLTSSAAGSSNSSSSLTTMTGATTMTPLSPTATRTQAPRAASARHRLSAIPSTHLPPPPPPPPVSSSVSVVPPNIDQDQDHDMHDDNDNDNHFDDLMQDDFDHGMQDDLPPTQTYNIHPTTPPPTSSSSSASVSPSSSAVPLIHTYSTQPHHMGLPQPQPHSSHSHLSPSDTQQQQLAQATVNEGDFRTVNFKINGVVVPMLVDVMSLRAAIFS